MDARDNDERTPVSRLVVGVGLREYFECRFLCNLYLVIPWETMMPVTSLSGYGAAAVQTGSQSSCTNRA